MASNSDPKAFNSYEEYVKSQAAPQSAPSDPKSFNSYEEYVAHLDPASRVATKSLFHRTLDPVIAAANGAADDIAMPIRSLLGLSPSQPMPGEKELKEEHPVADIVGRALPPIGVLAAGAPLASKALGAVPPAIKYGLGAYLLGKHIK